MSSAVKSLSASDISVLPYKVNKQFSYESSSLYENNIIVYKGYYDSGSSLDSLLEEQLNYFSAKQLYYSGFITSSISNTSGSYYYNFEQSTAASGTFEEEIRNFPTAQRSEIRIISIPQSLFGERIKPKTFILEDSSAPYYIVDDGNGNLYDIQGLGQPYIVDGYIIEDYFERVDINELPLVGNVIYAHGIAIITNQDYLYIFPKNCTLSDATAYYVANDCTITGAFAYYIPPSVTPSITPSISISATPSITPSITPSVTITATPSISISKTPSATPSLSPTPTPSLTPTNSVTPSQTINVSSTPSPSPTPITFTWLGNIDLQNSNFEACDTPTSAPRYTSTNIIIVGTTIFYTDSGKTTPWAGNSVGWYSVQKVGTVSSRVNAVRLNSSGLVLEATACFL